jgi:FMN phosphatase YigB (HAD superfamily)
MTIAALPPECRVLLFDLDGTLYRQGLVRRRLGVRLFLWVLAHPSPRSLSVITALRAYRQAQEDLRDHPPVHNLTALQFQRAAQAAGLPEALIRDSVELWMEQRPLGYLAAAIRPGLAGFLAAAQTQGLRLAVCSDYPATSKLEAMGLTDSFDVTVCAQDTGVGCFKPNPRILQVALTRAGGFAPRQALLLGDRAAVDGEAARRIGMPFLLMGSPQTADFFAVAALFGWSLPELQARRHAWRSG